MSVVLKLSEERLEAVESEIRSKAGELLEERDELVRDIKKLKRGTGTKTATSAPVTSDDELKAAIAHLTKGNDTPAAVKASAIAEHLGVDSRSFARRLSSLAQAGEVGGSKDDGYSVV